MPGAAKIFLSFLQRKEQDKNSIWGILLCCGCEEHTIEKCSKDIYCFLNIWVYSDIINIYNNSGPWAMNRHIFLLGNAFRIQCVTHQLSFPLLWPSWRSLVERAETQDGNNLYLWVTSCWELLWRGVGNHFGEALGTTADFVWAWNKLFWLKSLSPSLTLTVRWAGDSKTC